MDRTITEDRAGHGESRDSYRLTCNGISAGIAGAVDGQDYTLGLLQGHAGANLIKREFPVCEGGGIYFRVVLVHRRHESTVYLVRDRV
ncbi:MAG: hypothetical protein CAF42_011455 [Nitrospira sp. CG24B]|nr:MAG: hypothetical protein CAF42_011455 [Nitrospira sp. CG24B]